MTRLLRKIMRHRHGIGFRKTLYFLMAPMTAATGCRAGTKGAMAGMTVAHDLDEASKADLLLFGGFLGKIRCPILVMFKPQSVAVSPLFEYPQRSALPPPPLRAARVCLSRASPWRRARGVGVRDGSHRVRSGTGLRRCCGVVAWFQFGSVARCGV